MAAVVQRRYREVGVLLSHTLEESLLAGMVHQGAKVLVSRFVRTSGALSAEDGGSRTKSPPALVTGICLRNVYEIWAQ